MKLTEHRIQVGLFKWAKLASARHPELAFLFAIPAPQPPASRHRRKNKEGSRGRLCALTWGRERGGGRGETGGEPTSVSALPPIH